MTYIAALRQLARALRLKNRLVDGVNHAGIQKRLLSEKDLTFTKVLDIAQALKAAKKGTKALTIPDATQIEVKDLTTLLRNVVNNQINSISY